VKKHGKHGAWWKLNVKQCAYSHDSATCVYI
jgi:hypothetical protein